MTPATIYDPFDQMQEAMRSAGAAVKAFLAILAEHPGPWRAQALKEKIFSEGRLRMSSIDDAYLALRAEAKLVDYPGYLVVYRPQPS